MDDTQKRLAAWERERTENRHGFADVADEIIRRLNAEINWRTNALTDWSGAKVVNWGKVPK